MELALILSLVTFLFMYSLKVVVGSVGTLYNIYVDAKDRAEDEDEKNKMPESVKHLYS